MSNLRIRVSAFIDDSPVPAGGVCTERTFRKRRPALEYALAVSRGMSNFDDPPKRALVLGASKNWDLWFHPGGRIERRERELWGYCT